MGNSPLKNKKIIVVGGGYAGTSAAKELDPLCEVTLITPLDSLEHKWSFMRAVVRPGWEAITRVPLDNLLKNGKIVRGEVTSVSSNSVTLKDGTKLEADFIILAHGIGNGNLPNGFTLDAVTADAFKAKVVEKQDAIRAADRIMIVGGGAVGVELAGEIRAFYPKKKITIVHSQAKLCNNSTPPMIDKFVVKLMGKLEKVNIEVKLNTKATDLPPITNQDGFIHGTREYQLSDGSSMYADLAIVCVGSVHRDNHVVASEFLDEKNHVKVDFSLQVVGMQNVFCVGDANNIPESKLGFYALEQGKLAANNIKLLAQGKSLKLHKPSHGAKEYGTMVVPLGPKIGVGAIEGMVIGDGFSSLVKGKGLRKKHIFGDLNAKLPKVPN